MKKSLIVLMFLIGALFASDGEAIYKAKCAACHQMQGMMDMSQMQAMRTKMQNASDEEKAQMKAKMKEKMAKSGMKAPPMNMVSMRIKKMNDGDKAQFVAFVKDYIVNPSQDKGVCMPMAYKRFGVMPAIGKGMSDAERETVAVWMYDYFKERWGNSKDAKMCDQNNGKSKKCGSGKCGSSKCGGAKK